MMDNTIQMKVVPMSSGEADKVALSVTVMTKRTRIIEQVTRWSSRLNSNPEQLPHDRENNSNIQMTHDKHSAFRRGH
jgi:hypothetical protein